MNSSLLLTMGDPSGIGPEVVIKAVLELKDRLPLRFVIIGDKRVLKKHCLKLKAKNFFKDRSVALIDLENVKEKNFKFGRSTPEYGRASLEYIDEAIKLLKKNNIRALVTAPVNKASVNSCGMSFSGHTEYLAHAFGAKDFIMMLINRNLRVVPLTRHIALKKVQRELKVPLIRKGLACTLDYLKEYFSIPHPRIAVCALNPHSGDAGLFGKEEREMIIPAIKEIRRKNKDASIVLYSADALFTSNQRNRFDCIIGMYHDQVLIPVKFSNCLKVVNLTLGLPFIRTSPCHGTAFDIAGREIASSNSMVEAIKLAYKLTKNVHA